MKISLILLILMLAFCFYMLAKNENTWHVQRKIDYAIFSYNIEAINTGKYDSQIGYDAVESYEKTLWRVWDWDYKRCVSPEILAKLEPFFKDGASDA